MLATYYLNIRIENCLGTTQDKETTLHRAAVEGNIGVAKVLISQGEDVNAKSQVGVPWCMENSDNSVTRLKMS